MKCLVSIAVYTALLLYLSRPSFAQADEVPALLKSRSAMRLLPAMAGQKLIIEGTRTLLLEGANLPAKFLPKNAADMKQELLIKDEIAVLPRAGVGCDRDFPWQNRKMGPTGNDGAAPMGGSCRLPGESAEPAGECRSSNSGFIFLVAGAPTGECGHFTGCDQAGSGNRSRPGEAIRRVRCS